MAGVQRGRESEINAKDVGHVRAHIVTWQCTVTWPMSLQPISPFPPQPFGSNWEEELPKKPVGQLSVNCWLVGQTVDRLFTVMQSHSARGSKSIRVSSNHFLMNIINYKPKMELLFILHDFMLPPSFRGAWRKALSDFW